MKRLLLALLLLLIFSVKSASAQTITNPTPTPPVSTSTEAPASSSGTLSSFFSGFDWVSSGLIFNTPSILDKIIKLNDGTELSGLSSYRNIFYDIATPLFVLIISFIALSHITHDNTAQLKNFVKRLVFVIALFIITPSILGYSIQFINLLNNAINGQAGLNFISFITDYVNSGDFMKTIQASSSPILLLFSPNSLIQIILFIIAIGFFLIGFLYVVFQAMIRFIALLLLSVIFPLVLPFALSERTENITNTYFKMWFTFLIQQPAFVLGFAIVSTVLGSLLKAHGGSIGTLFLFSGSLIFLGGVNVLIARLFGDGWSLVASNYQSLIASSTINRFNTSTVNEVKRGAITGRPSGIRSYAGVYLGKKMGLIPNKKDNSNSGFNTNNKKLERDNLQNNFISKNKRSYLKVYSKNKGEALI